MKGVRVRVPAATANLGPGFDVLGLALALHNEVEMCWSRLRPCRGPGETLCALRQLRLQVEIRGEGADTLPRGKRNLVYRAAAEVFREARLVPGEVRLRLLNRIPLARGLGSSGAAAIGGLLAANEACRRAFSHDDVLRIATRLEGHSDDVAASLLGGLTAVMMTQDGPRAFRLPLPDRYRCVVAIPAFQLLTSVARRCLPHRIRRADAIFSLSRAAILSSLLARGAYKGLAEAMKDRLHQPQRARLIRGLEQVIESAVSAGALGAALSGAGPAVVALVPKSGAKLAHRVGCSMTLAFHRTGVEACALTLDIDKRGARVNRLG